MKNHIATLIFAVCAGGVFTAGMAHADFDSWYEKLQIKGDLRYRFENIQKDKTTERDRQRIRVRLSLDAPLDDYWMVKTRLATNDMTDPVSTNETLGDVFNKDPLSLDVAALEYKLLFDNLTLKAGKIDNPFTNVGKNQLIWDGDLTLEGIAGSAKVEVIPEANLFAKGGGFWLLEQSSNFDPMMYGGQIGFTGKIMDVKYTVGGSYYYYKDTKNQTTFVSSTSGFGNSTVAMPAATRTVITDPNGNTIPPYSTYTLTTAAASTKYAYNYKIAEAFLELSLKVMDFPLALYANAVKNADDSVASRNTGYTAGFVFNKAKAEGSWDIGYYARKLDKDAVVGAFSDSDFLGGGTDGLGHVATASYMLTDSVKLKATHFNNQIKADLDLSRTGYHRTQVDVELSY
ncbi:MAG: putative porin [candidate division FCPU426 bacterium]